MTQDAGPRVRFARSTTRFFAFVPPELHLPFAMHAITTLDNLWMDRPRSIAAGLLESDGHRSIVDPGPGSTFETLHQGLQAHGLGVGDRDAFFFSSRRRHTRWTGDWSSDVCSSD